MRRSFLLCLASTSVPLVLGAAVFNWPDPRLDTLDDQLYRPFFSAASRLALNCTARGGLTDTNATVAAQWLRLAYHDVATHNSTTGTGGLDASIAYEFNHLQNVGVGMLESLLDFATAPNEYVSMADVIAQGVIHAVIDCGGPIIPYRGGRVDATEAGPETVPEPQQDLASHIASFQAQGFNQTEMITLVACGHSLGESSGVRKVDFPLIVTENASTGIQNFASTLGFDNTVVTEYLDSTTDNVLVVGTNISTRSDLRIFSSDANVTMQRLASPDTFNEVCADLIGRMIDTVPSTVTLTDVIEPFDFKVWNTMLFPRGGSLAFLATLRIITAPGLSRTVTMFWTSRTGTFCPAGGCSAQAFEVTTSDSTLLGQLKGIPSFDLHSFNPSIDLATSISSFWFEVNNNDGSTPFIVDNNGANYIIEQDVLLFDPRRSNFSTGGTTMVVGVKDSSTNANVTALSTLTGSTTLPLPSRDTVVFEVDATNPPADGYTFYAATLSRKAISNSIHATINGTAYSLWVPFTSAAGA
ncbi:Peroxidase [Mycena venus]|uniref:Peroxidase n=1 Tax=Mycena venus TaxID=2733690 RepID=A0A8H7D1M0_9AGAR|nr:Peroxidase [Mycena venus]